MRGVGRDGIREQHIHGVIEADHVEAVAGLQATERVNQACLGLHDRGAAHRTGIVDDEDHLARQRLLFRLLQRRRRDEGQQVVGVADMFAEQPDRGRLFSGRLPGQLEVVIGRHRTFSEPDNARHIVGAFDLDGVVVALHFAERKTGP
jgi:hypothetical protein